jgi:hypothetical protein
MMGFADPAYLAVAILLLLLVLTPWALLEADRLRVRLWQRRQLRAVLLRSRRR